MLIVLVDGVGRCALREIPDEELPGTFGIARPYVASGPDRLEIFVRTADADPDGRRLYRQRGVSAAEVRWAYLAKSPILIQPPPSA